MPNWAEQVTAIATAVSAIGLLERHRCGHLRRATNPGGPNRPASRDRGRILQTVG